MKKTIIIAVVVILLLAIGLAVYFLLINRGSGSSGQVGLPGTGTLPIASTTVPTSTTLTLGTSQGNVTVNNFYTNAAYVTQDQQTVVLGEQAQYSIVYNVGDSSFIISLLSSPLQAARQAAEAAFMKSLGATKQNACKLKVVEGIPASVSDQYVGQSFPLSFCGGPTTL